MAGKSAGKACKIIKPTKAKKKELVLLTMKDCEGCVVAKKALKPFIVAKKIKVLDGEKGEGDRISEELGIKYLPALVAREPKGEWEEVNLKKLLEVLEKSGLS